LIRVGSEVVEELIRVGSEVVEELIRVGSEVVEELIRVGSEIDSRTRASKEVNAKPGRQDRQFR
jgi:hypothetical protein